MKITTVSWDESFKERLKDPEYAYKLIEVLTKESEELERRLKIACEGLADACESPYPCANNKQKCFYCKLANDLRPLEEK